MPGVSGPVSVKILSLHPCFHRVAQMYHMPRHALLALLAGLAALPFLSRPAAAFSGIGEAVEVTVSNSGVTRKLKARAAG